MKKKSVVSIGMFNLFKAVAMPLIIVGHTFSVFDFGMDSPENSVFTILLSLISSLMIPVGNAIFFIVCGYGFRKEPIKKSINHQIRFILKPYVISAISTSILHLVTRYMVTRSKLLAIKMTWQVLAGFLIGIPKNHEIAGTTIYFIGSLWFLLALLVAWLVFDVLLTYIPEPFMFPAVMFCASIGCLLQQYELDYYCISRGLFAVLYMYVGYFIKKRKLLHNDINPNFYVLTFLSFFAMLVYAFFSLKSDSSIYTLCETNLSMILLFSFVGAMLLICILQVNRLPIGNNGLIKMVGEYSLYILCAHTIEMHGIPWYRMAEVFGNDSIVAFILTLILRGCFVALVTFFCVKWKSIKKVFAFKRS